MQQAMQQQGQQMQQAMQQQGQQMQQLTQQLAQQGQQLAQHGQQLLCLYVYFLIFEGPVTGIEVIQ